LTLDDIDRLHQRLDKVFDLISEQQKILHDCQGELKVHLDTSILRVAGYDKDIVSVQNSMDNLDVRVEKLEKYIADLESKKKGVESLGTLLKWIVGLIVGGITIYTFWGKK
jgi:tetrahydromethanopterin S-methyltransferase subunit G